MACWPANTTGESRPAVRALLAYNLLVALYLVYLATGTHLGRPLLWPVAAAHGAMTLLLIAGGRDARQMPRESPS